MNRFRISRALAALVLSTLLAFPAFAQDGWWVRFSYDEWEKINREYNKGNEAYAQREWRRLAEMGDPRSQSSLGLSLYLAWAARHENYSIAADVVGDVEEAVVWLERAAAQGYAFAMYMLSAVYKNGHGIPVDRAKSAYWMIAAADNGNHEAQFEASRIYLNGEGVSADPVRAYMWWRLAGGLFAGNPDDETEQRFSALTQAQRTEAERLATAWIGDLKARNPRGWLLWHIWLFNIPTFMVNISPSKIDAARRIAEARFFDIEFGDDYYVTATRFLADVYGAGNGVSVDAQEAARWRDLSEQRETNIYLRRAERGSSWAVRVLERRYREGQGVERNLVEAAKWFLIGHQSSDNGASRRPDYESELTPDQIAEAGRRAADWLAAHRK